MYYIHTNSGNFLYKTRRKKEAFSVCEECSIPVNVSILRHGKFTQILCNLKHSKNLYETRR